MLDSDLADIYNIKTKALNQAVKRNKERFPNDFMFRLTTEEKKEVVTNCDHLNNLKFTPTLPYAFTEHGAIMLASVINSPRAIEASIFIVRVFVRMREYLLIHKDISNKIDELERRVAGHDKHIRALFDAIRQLMIPPEKPRRRIGFHRSNGK